MKSSALAILIAVPLATLTVGCGDDTPAGQLVDVGAEPAGANCENGGTVINTGFDDDGDGVLDPEEVDDTDYICAGSDTETLVLLSEEPPGDNCPTGGTAVRSGPDANGNGALDDDEVTSTQYACDGSAFDSVIVGSLDIRNPLDLYLLQRFTEITGNLFIGEPIPELVHLNLPALTTIGGSLLIGSQSNLETISLPALESIGGQVDFISLPSLTSLDLSALTTIDEDMDFVNVGDAASPATVDLSSLQTVPDTFDIDSNSDIASLDLSSLTSAGRIDIKSGDLTTLTIPVLATLGESFTIAGTALATLAAPELTTTPKISVLGNSSLTTLSLGKLTTVTDLFEFQENDVLTCTEILAALNNLGSAPITTTIANNATASCL